MTDRGVHLHYRGVPYPSTTQREHCTKPLLFFYRHLTLKYGISKRSDHKENKTVNTNKTKDYREKRIAELMSVYKQRAKEEDPDNGKNRNMILHFSKDHSCSPP